MIHSCADEKFTKKRRRKVERVSCPIFPFRPSRRQHDPKILMRSCVDLCTHKLFSSPSYYNYTCFPFTNHSESSLSRASHVATSSLFMFSNAISTDFPQLHSFGSALFLRRLISYVHEEPPDRTAKAPEATCQIQDELCAQLTGDR